jgi:hypothetical protein
MRAPLASSRLAVAATLGALSAFTGCGGSGAYEEDPNWQSKDSISTQDDQSAFVDRKAPPPVVDPNLDWVGVRPDLAIAQSQPRQATCSCLTVEVGQPTDPKFTWEGTMPRIAGSKLAVAVSAFGIDCPGGPADDADRRPSIRAVDRRGKDVVIEIEQIPVDRPVASGAIIHPPDQGGAIYVRPRSKDLPYAKPVSGELCRVR